MGIIATKESNYGAASNAPSIASATCISINSTPKLRYQAELENERRWLAFDLLTGSITNQHPLWTYFTEVGIDEAELDWFTDNPCPPDIIGINHYLTSERFLDERMERYPVC